MLKLIYTPFCRRNSSQAFLNSYAHLFLATLLLNLLKYVVEKYTFDLYQNYVFLLSPEERHSLSPNEIVKWQLSWPLYPVLLSRLAQKLISSRRRINFLVNSKIGFSDFCSPIMDTVSELLSPKRITI